MAIVGFRLAQSQSPDLIVLDIFLKGSNGLELLRRLNQDEKTQNIPIFLITALNVPTYFSQDDPNWDEAKQALSYLAYLPKPINLDEFLRQTESILNPQKARYMATGPGVVLLVPDAAQRETFRATLREKNFAVFAYANLTQSLQSLLIYQPLAVVIDESLIHADFWTELKEIRRHIPNFSVLVLRTAHTENMPDHVPQVDFWLNQPCADWQMVQMLERALEVRQADIRLQILSASLYNLNSLFLESQQSYIAQGEELKVVNRHLLQQHESQSLLTGMLVHDLKSPLGSILNTFQFLEMDRGNTFSKHSQRILKGGSAAGNQMLRIVNAMLMEQQLKNGEIALEIEEIDFEDILAGTLTALEAFLTMHSVSVETNIPAELPPVMADGLTLQRVVENLLDNAIKHSPRSEPVFVQAAVKENFLEVCIADQGDGILPEHRDLVFEPFSQLDNTVLLDNLKRSIGLGLAFCKMAVEAMGGKIWVDSLNGTGAAFYLTIPLSLNE